MKEEELRLIYKSVVLAKLMYASQPGGGMLQPQIRSALKHLFDEQCGLVSIMPTIQRRRNWPSTATTNSSAAYWGTVTTCWGNCCLTRQATSTTSEVVVTTCLSLLKLMTGILLSDSYFVTPISIFNISPSLSSQLRTAVTLTLLEQYMLILIDVAMRFVIAFIKPIFMFMFYVYHQTWNRVTFCDPATQWPGEATDPETEWEMFITAQGYRLRNDLYCVEWDVKL